MISEENDPPILLAVADGVAVVTLNRPARQNAWTPAMARLYPSALIAAGRDPAVRAIVVTGAGRHFCPGGDGEELAGIAGEGAIDAAGDRAPPWTALATGKPVIAAVGGVCFGFGLYQALCCDVRLAADDAKFSTAYARRGLVAEMGMSWLLPRIVGVGRAADMLFTARVVRADEAERFGLVNRVVPAATLLDEAIGYARLLATQASPRSLRAMKRQLYADLDGGFAAAFARAGTLLDEAVAAPDFAEGIGSWVERRPPAFAPLPPELGTIEVD